MNSKEFYNLAIDHIIASRNSKLAEEYCLICSWINYSLKLDRAPLTIAELTALKITEPVKATDEEFDEFIEKLSEMWKRKNESIEIEQTNTKWLKAMKSLDLGLHYLCPSTNLEIPHRLTAYRSATNTERIVTCTRSNCEFYDYNTFRVSMDTRLAPGIMHV